mgnify:CR=1 FL=1
MEEKNICGARVREARKRIGLAQVELAAALEIEWGVVLDQSDISEIERAARLVRDVELRALAAVLEVDLHWLVDWQRPQYATADPRP